MMTNNRSVLLISAIALILLALIPAASANMIIYDEELFEFIDTTKIGEKPDMGGRGPDYYVRDIVFKDITKAQHLDFLVYELDGDRGKWLDGTKIEEGRHEFTYRFNGADRPGVLYLNRKTNSLGQVTSTQFTISLKEWDIGDLRGKQIIEMPFSFHYGVGRPIGSGGNVNTNTYLGSTGTSGERVPTIKIKITEKTAIMWKHHLRVAEDTNYYHVDIDGFIDGYRFTSQVNFKNDGELFATFANQGEEIHRSFVKTDINLIEIISPQGREYAFPLGGVAPGDSEPVVIYVKSSQTGALLADAHIVIKDTRTAPWTEVVNQTLPSGQGSFYLPKDSGFNPSQYHISATVPGYKQVVPAHFFRVTGPMSVVVEMEPTEGGPDDEDNAFLEFYVRDLDGNGISNAQVYVGGQLRWTNAQGFTQVEVAKNTGYSYTVSKSGYVTVKGSVTVGDGSRYTVNVVLGPEGVPTQTPGTDPGTSTVNIYVKSSQTGALLANAHVVIKDTSTDPWREVVNQTLPSGHGTVTLAKDPGFNPTQYHISATVPGYQQVVPAHFFRVTGSMSVVVEMEPLEGGPDDENNTFLEFYVRDLNANPVSNAQVLVGGQLRWTNAQGFTQFEVAKNASYPYSVSKSGYVTIEGTATVADDPRYVVNVVLGPATIPTHPPGTPPIEPTPTSGIPDDDDGSEGFLMEAVRGISKLFGVGFSTAKSILGMLLALSIGFATAKHLRGGATEFGIGLLGGTMLGILIGLLPVWTIVVLLLVVGLYIGHRYVGGGNNG